MDAHNIVGDNAGRKMELKWYSWELTLHEMGRAVKDLDPQSDLMKLLSHYGVNKSTVIQK